MAGPRPHHPVAHAFAAVLMGVFALDVGWHAPASRRARCPRPANSCAAVPPCGWRSTSSSWPSRAGLFIVPAFTALQAWSDEARRARTIAAVNVLNAAFMVGGTVAWRCCKRGPPHAGPVRNLGLTNLAAAILSSARCPRTRSATFCRSSIGPCIRMEVRGAENLVKPPGPTAILALNHVSFLDAGVALSLLDRDPVFAIDSGIARLWWVRPFLRLTRAMPLDPTKPLATRTLINAVRAGDSLVIFPEGRISVTGSLMKIYDGAGLIAEKAGALVVPIRIDGLERTPFSRLSRTQVRRKLVAEGNRHGAGTGADRRRSRPLRPQAAPGRGCGPLRRNVRPRVPHHADRPHGARGADRRRRRSMAGDVICLEDPMRGRHDLLPARSWVRPPGPEADEACGTGEDSRRHAAERHGSAVTVFALMSAGRVPAMINFSAGLASVQAACRAADVRVIVSSRAFIEKGKLEKLVAGLEGGDAAARLPRGRPRERQRPRQAACLIEPRRPLVDRKPDDRAAILFTSGSEGTPKGVVLSHRNMLANVAQVAARIDFGRTDKVFDVLPLFHSFGLTAALILPLVSGVQVYLYPSPLHYRIVPELIYGTNATALFGTDTFLAGYARFANAYDFRSLRYVVAGAEPVKESTRAPTWKSSACASWKAMA